MSERNVICVSAKKSMLISILYSCESYIISRIQLCIWGDMDKRVAVRPRQAKNAEKVGAYLLASRINSTVVDPGKFFEFEQYITGYGEISSPKLQCYISGDIFESGTDSYLKNGMALENGQPWFGNANYCFEGEGFTCYLAGINFPGESTCIVDANENGFTSLMTEKKLKNAPFTYKLKIKKNVKPGDYRIDVYFTYFNGEKWQCSKETVGFKVRNFFERWSAPLSILGVLVATSALIRFAVTLFGNGF